jgi:signal transduction histidine kinase
MFRRSTSEMRVLILAPVGRDARLLADTLAALDIETKIASDAENHIALLTEGAGAAIITEEALTADHIQSLAAWLGSQPPWSDMPLVILTSGGRATLESQRRAHELETLGNFTLIERPVRPETVQSAVRAALRARSRQYEMRSHQEALMRANADLEQFAHSASHDLAEPIRSISVYSELLTNDYARLLDQRGNAFLGFIYSAAQRMETLLADLLAYAHASSIPDEPPEPICAREPLDAALENLAGAIRETSASITVGEMPMVRVRKSHLEQIFQNLVGNAIKYRRDDSVHVWLAAQRENNHWLFCVEDNGIGIAPEYRETVFGIFKRLHTNQKYSGTGMGLAICQRIVERYRGRIWVESEPGRGSKFLFTIPAEGRK